MKVLALALSLFYATPAVSCVIDVLSFPGANPTVAKWVHGGLKAHNLCVTLIVTPTKSSGQNDRKHKLGNRNTVIVVSNKIDPHQPVDIIYWFHGLTGFKESTFKNRLVPQYAWLANNKNHPVILVVTEMPWSTFTRTQWKRQGMVFRRPDEFYNYTLEVEEHVMRLIAHVPPIRFNRVVIGHSAGGSAIASAAKYGGLCKAKPAGIVFSDSTYGNWFEKSWKGCLKEYSKKSEVRIVVLGQSSGTPWKRYSRWAKFNRLSSKGIEAHRLPYPWTHGKIGSNAIPFYYHRFTSGIYEDIYESR